MNDYNIYDYIRGLLEKFYNAETTREEELELTDFFRSATDLPTDLEADRKMFAMLTEAQAFAEVPADLDAKIMSAIDASGSSDDDSERQLLASVESSSVAPSRSGSRLRRIFIGISAAAAVVALVLLLPFSNERTVDGTPGQQQLASEKILDTLKNMEIIPGIPSVKQLAATNIAQTKADEKSLPDVKTPEQPKIAYAKHKTMRKPKAKAEPEEEYTLSEEEIQALEMASSALDNASQKLAYAYNCISESQTCIMESDQLLNRILEK